MSGYSATARSTTTDAMAIWRLHSSGIMSCTHPCSCRALRQLAASSATRPKRKTTWRAWAQKRTAHPSEPHRLSSATAKLKVNHPSDNMLVIKTTAVMVRWLRSRKDAENFRSAEPCERPGGRGGGVVGVTQPSRAEGWASVRGTTHQDEDLRLPHWRGAPLALLPSLDLLPVRCGRMHVVEPHHGLFFRSPTVRAACSPGVLGVCGERARETPPDPTSSTDNAETADVRRVCVLSIGLGRVPKASICCRSMIGSAATREGAREGPRGSRSRLELVGPTSAALTA